MRESARERKKIDTKIREHLYHYYHCCVAIVVTTTRATAAVIAITYRSEGVSNIV